ncbi:putative oxidoreductase (fatty acid repression mutant protein) [Alkalihalobacillus xiaoxiensis]|uniref:Oxidoreductase (Fatty acid repression mutant protein) n=1 Tax=Shouchella xiaoxiensis TaxID=766895 RepID=A0ABS2SUI0_9BACI|nr:nitroreductase family protein [Shouchella xiaoxiensis]MBM7838661.1 putative oxidoreductase (fatty acid repression mutant protein) [Shouchella xiaoxiensis]
MTLFYEAVEKRRSTNKISKELDISDERIEEIISHALKYVPSAFNSQTTRVLLLLGKEHDWFWSETETLIEQAGTDYKQENSEVALLKAGYGTVLFFEDENAVAAAQRKNPQYLEYFAEWADQTSGMHQLAVWTAFEIEGIGASLQHYQPHVDEMVSSRWSVPASWKLKAQMPFGKPLTSSSNEKGNKENHVELKIFK